MVSSTKLNKKKSLKIAFAGACAILLFILAYFYFGKKSDEIKEDPQSVMVSEARFGPVVKYINSIGILVPNDSVDLKSEVSAKAEQIYFEDGAVVEKGALLIQFDESLAKAELMEAEARYNRAKIEFELLDKLTDRGAAAKIKREQSLADMRISSANLNSAKTKLEKHKIFAPFGGMIGIKNISVGQFIQSGTELVKLVDNHPMKVDFTIAETDIDKIYVSQELQVFVGGDASQEYSAKISAIEPESDKINHSFKVRAVLDVPEEIAMSSQNLKAGRFVKIRISINDGQQGIVIPESAIEKVGGEDIVYIVSDGLAIRRSVITGMRRGGNVEIITGVNEGDTVITKGQQGVSDGRAVTIRDSYKSTEIIDAYKKYRNRLQKTKGKK